MKKVFTRFHIFLSHHSYLYALLVGVGIVLFWRGVWHTVDLVHIYIDHYSATAPLDSVHVPWWDGPLSFFVGCLLLYTTRAFVSSFIGNELILSGLRSERRMAKETEGELKSEIFTINDLKHTLSAVARKLDELEVQVKDHHKK